MYESVLKIMLDSVINHFDGSKARIRDPLRIFSTDTGEEHVLYADFEVQELSKETSL